jgi:subtilase family serine protease
VDSKGLWLLGFYIDNVMKWNNSWSDLGAGKTLRGLGPYTPDAEGTHNFKCVLDVNNQIAERHEDNNNKEILFMVVK